MKRQEKTPRTKQQRRCQDAFDDEGFHLLYGAWRRLPKGRRTKSGQWWKRPIPKTFIVVDEFQDSNLMAKALGLKTREQWLESHDEVDTDTGFGPLWIPK